MHRCKILTRLTHHNIQLTTLLSQLLRIECLALGLLFGDELISDWAEVVVECMVDEAVVGFVQALEEGLSCVFLGFVVG